MDRVVYTTTAALHHTTFRSVGFSNRNLLVWNTEQWIQWNMEHDWNDWWSPLIWSLLFAVSTEPPANTNYTAIWKGRTTIAKLSGPFVATIDVESSIVYKYYSRHLINVNSTVLHSFVYDHFESDKWSVLMPVGTSIQFIFWLFSQIYSIKRKLISRHLCIGRSVLIGTWH